MTRRVGVDEARAFFVHPSQLRGSMLENADDLHPGLDFIADGPVCMGFHAAPWPDALFCHLGVMPSGWGSTTEPVGRILAACGASTVVAWVKADNRAVRALGRRCGFIEIGQIIGGAAVMLEWRQTCR